MLLSWSGVWILDARVVGVNLQEETDSLWSAAKSSDFSVGHTGI